MFLLGVFMLYGFVRILYYVVRTSRSENLIWRISKEGGLQSKTAKTNRYHFIIILIRNFLLPEIAKRKI